MSGFLRQTLLLVVAAALSWFFLLKPRESLPAPATRTEQALAVALMPLVAEGENPGSPLTSELPIPLPVEAPAEDVAVEEVPPPPEVGVPEGEEESEARTAEAPGPELTASGADSAPDASAPASAAQAEELMGDPALLALAREEFSGEAAKGFETVLLSVPEEQLEIARFFGEELVLIPRSILDPQAENPRYFQVRLSPGGEAEVQTVAGRPPLERYRQYRDLFDYEYARLPKPLRELRRSVLARNEVYLFAALIPAREWAVVIGRREEALARFGAELSDVRRFVLRYVKRSDGGFDLDVEEIVFADGRRSHPEAAVGRAGHTPQEPENPEGPAKRGV